MKRYPKSTMSRLKSLSLSDLKDLAPEVDKLLVTTDIKKLTPMRMRKEKF